jgi:hypothetical protein
MDVQLSTWPNAFVWKLTISVFLGQIIVSRLREWSQKISLQIYLEDEGFT